MGYRDELDDEECPFDKNGLRAHVHRTIDEILKAEEGLERQTLDPTRMTSHQKAVWALVLAVTERMKAAVADVPLEDQWRVWQGMHELVLAYYNELSRNGLSFLKFVPEILTELYKGLTAFRHKPANELTLEELIRASSVGADYTRALPLVAAVLKDCSGF